MITEDNFKWTDELVKEFLDKYQLNRSWITGFDPTKEQMINFKKFKQPKKDYEVVSSCAEMWKSIKSGSYQVITSVKRLPDNEIFKIGDNTLHGTIEGFIESWCGLEVHFTNKKGELLAKIEKEKIVLFVTEDGVNVYKGDSVILISTTTWVTHKHFIAIDITKHPFKGVNGKPSFLYFSNEDAAKSYIIWNKPHFSVSEIMSLSQYYDRGLENERIIFNSARLKEVSEQKIN
jgi:hypothetical protein